MKKSSFAISVILLFFIAMSVYSCKFSSSGVTLNVAEKPFDCLSQYHFFSDELKGLKPNAGVLPYDLISTLFSDYAKKARFVFIPKGKNVTYQDKEVLNLPVGSCYIKNFYYPFDLRDETKGRRIIETRLLVHREEGWDALDYIWNDEQTEAKLEVAGDIKKVSWIETDGVKRDIDYVIPNKNQCKGCHWNNKADAIIPIGPKVRNLNHAFAYSDGTKNQLEKWTAFGFLKGAPDAKTCPKMANYNDEKADLNDRARAYLDVNCAHCHNPNGPAYTSGLFLNYDNDDLEHLGICKSPVAAGKGTGDRLADIVPGNHDASILSYRMASDDAGSKMPEVGRTLVHKEGVALINAWIDNMKPNACKQ